MTDTMIPEIRFQPTPPAQGATLAGSPYYPQRGISTHAPRTGGDNPILPSMLEQTDFNPRPPHRGRHLRAVTHQGVEIHFNPRPPHRGRQGALADALRPGEFQPTPPAQGATVHDGACGIHGIISTHAPRTGGDGHGTDSPMTRSNFNPRPPHRGRLISREWRYMDYQISTHAPRTGGDRFGGGGRVDSVVFQPTPPAQGATRMPVSISIPESDFNPRPPHRGRLSYVSPT